MKKIISILGVLTYFSVPVFPQIEDTTVVQVISFSDGLDNRRAWRYFPNDDGTTYRQILMYQTLKCDPTLISNPTNSGCGEWDTGENFLIYDHRFSDSLRYRVGFEYPDTIQVTSTPTTKSYQNYQYSIVYDGVISETNNLVGVGIDNLGHSLQTSLHSNRAQYLYKASELTASGLVTGEINKIELEVVTVGQTTINDLLIRMKNTALEGITETDHETDGLEEVYRIDTDISSTGVHTFNLTYPFEWDGTSNVVIDISFSNDAVSTDFQIKGESTAYSSAVYATQDDQYYELHHRSYVDVETTNLSQLLDSNVTISFWTQTYTDDLIANLVPFEAVDSANIYQMLINLPNTNPKIQWYAGRELNAGLDNLSSATLASFADLEGGWTHWAFTRNSTTSDMVIYRNGQIYLQSTTGNSNRIIDRIAEFRIGADRASNNRFYSGKMNEFRVWNKDLDQSTVQDWLYKDVNATHPNYSNLIGYFKFDVDGNMHPLDETGTSQAAAFGLPSQHFIPGSDRFRNLSSASERPNITFVQGEYTSHLDSNLVITTVQDPATSIVVSENYQDLQLVGMQDFEIDTLHLWKAGYSYTYDQSGNVIDSMYNAPELSLYNYYTGNSNMLCKYITPYGNYLDLGEGFTWIYDVTEYEPLLHDTIDLQGGGNRELIDLQFRFIEGTPPQDVNKLQFLENVGGKYLDIVENPENYYNTIYPDENSTRFGIRASFSGHGFNNSTNCAEFCQRDHFIEVDGYRAYEWVHWKECADNPLYPQGGTWIYDRSGWCPGAPQDIYHFDLTDHVTPGETKTLFKGVDPDGTQYGNWGGFMYFISYGEPNFANDATVYDIIAPNAHDEHLRFNPICDNASIVIRNNGSTALTSAVIKYGIKGGGEQTYDWSGNLEFMETETVSLPMHTFWHWLGDEPEFIARIISVNGGVDEYEQNNANYARYTPPPVHPGFVKLRLKTNSSGSQTSWNLKDGYGNELYGGSGIANTTLVEEEMTLPVGCYTLRVDDSGDNGLSFWANNEGNGFCQLRDATNNAMLKSFEADFGDNIRYEFSVGGTVAVADLDQLSVRIEVFPNPSSGIYNLTLDNLEGRTVTVEVYDMAGKKIGLVDVIQNIGSGHHVSKLNLSKLSDGIYTLVFKTDNGTWARKVVKAEL